MSDHSHVWRRVNGEEAVVCTGEACGEKVAVRIMAHMAPYRPLTQADVQAAGDEALQARAAGKTDVHVFGPKL